MSTTYENKPACVEQQGMATDLSMWTLKDHKTVTVLTRTLPSPGWQMAHELRLQLHYTESLDAENLHLADHISENLHNP